MSCKYIAGLAHNIFGSHTGDPYDMNPYGTVSSLGYPILQQNDINAVSAWRESN